MSRNRLRFLLFLLDHVRSAIAEYLCRGPSKIQRLLLQNGLYEVSLFNLLSKVRFERECLRSPRRPTKFKMDGRYAWQSRVNILGIKPRPAFSRIRCLDRFCSAKGSASCEFRCTARQGADCGGRVAQPLGQKQVQGELRRSCSKDPRGCQ